MSVAGNRSEVFTKSGLRELYKSARGIPRLINVVADRALLAGYTRERRSVDGALVARAASEVFGGRPGGPCVALGVGRGGLAVLRDGDLESLAAGTGSRRSGGAADGSRCGRRCRRAALGTDRAARRGGDRRRGAGRACADARGTGARSRVRDGSRPGARRAADALGRQLRSGARRRRAIRPKRKACVAYFSSEAR